MLDKVIAIVEKDLPDPEFLATRWPALRERAHARWRSETGDAERERVVRELLEGLQVSHCVLITPAEERTIAHKTQDPRRLAPTLRRVGSTLLVAVKSFKAGTTTLPDLREIAREAASARGLVLDLRLNDGGSGGLVAELCGLFLPPGTRVLQVRQRAGLDERLPHVVSTFREDTSSAHETEVRALLEHPFVEYRTPEDPVGRFEGPVVVVVDVRCYSCGEVFVQALQEYGRAPVAGRPSAGMVIGARQHELGSGYGLLFPFAEMRSGKGALLEGRGVTPDVELEVEGLEDEALLEVLAGRGLLHA